MKKLIQILPLVLLMSCGKNNNTGTSRRSVSTSHLNLGSVYHPCHGSISGYCSKVEVVLRNGRRFHVTCPVSNLFMSTGELAYVQANYHRTGTTYFCDHSRNLI